MYEDSEITPQTKLSLTIDGNQNTSISIHLSVYSDPVNTKQGYEALPNEYFHWIQFAETDFIVPPKTKYSIPIIVDVPNETANYNKNWQFYIKVDQYAGGDSNGTATIQYDYNLLWTIKTPPRYIPQQTKSDQPPWLYFSIGIIILGIVAGFAIKRHKLSRKTKGDDVLDAFKE